MLCTLQISFKESSLQYLQYSNLHVRKIVPCLHNSLQKWDAFTEGSRQQHRHQRNKLKPTTVTRLQTLTTVNECYSAKEEIHVCVSVVAQVVLLRNCQHLKICSPAICFFGNTDRSVSVPQRAWMNAYSLSGLNSISYLLILDNLQPSSLHSLMTHLWDKKCHYNRETVAVYNRL